MEPVTEILMADHVARFEQRFEFFDLLTGRWRSRINLVMAGVLKDGVLRFRVRPHGETVRELRCRPKTDCKGRSIWVSGDWRMVARLEMDCPASWKSAALALLTVEFVSCDPLRIGSDGEPE